MMIKDFIFVDDDVENKKLNSLHKLIQKYKETNIETISLQMNWNLNLKNQKKKFAELLFEKENLFSDLEYLIKNKNYCLRTIVKNKNNKFKESLVWIPISVEEMNPRLTWKESSFCNSLNQKILLVIFKEINELETKIDDIFVINFDEKDKLNAKSVFYQTQIKFNNGGILSYDSLKNKNSYNFIKPSVDEFFHVRPKAKDSNDVYKTQYGEVITKQAFWINKNSIENKLSEFYEKNKSNNLIMDNDNGDKEFLHYLEIAENNIDCEINKSEGINKKKFQNFSILKWIYGIDIDQNKIFFKNNYDVILEDIKINSFNFSVRTKNALVDSKINSFKELINLSIKKLNSIENLGEKSKKEVLETLEKSIYIYKNAIPLTSSLNEKINYYINDLFCEFAYNKKLLKNIISKFVNSESLNDIDARTLYLLLKNDSEWIKYLEDFVINKIQNSSQKFITLENLKYSLKSAYFSDLEIIDFLDRLIEKKRILKIKNYLFIKRDKLRKIIETSAKDNIKNILKNQIIVENDNQTFKTKFNYELKKYFDSVDDCHETWFSEIYQNYYFDLESFLFITGWTEIEFLFFKYKFSQGNKNILSLCFDNNVPNFIKENTNEYRKKYWIKTKDGEFILKKKNDIFWYLIKNNTKNDTQFLDFYNLYNDFLKENNLLNDEDFTYSERVMEHKISDSNNILWKHKKIFRYFDFDLINKEEFIKDLHLERFNNKEIGTQILLDSDDIKEKYDFNDEYEIHNFLKKISKELMLPVKLTFLRMPGIGIGNFNRNEQVEKLVFAEAPIHKEKFAELYSTMYGVKKQNVLSNYLNNVSKYLINDIFEIDYIPFQNYEINFMQEKLVKKYYELEEIENIFLSEFKEGNVQKISKPNLDSIGFKIIGEHVYKKEFSNLEAVYRDYFKNKNEIVKLDINFNSNSSQNVKEEILGSYNWFQIDKTTFISSKMLFDKMELTIEDIHNFCESAIKFANNRIFTLKNLIKNGFNHKIFDLGFNDFFYESILRWNKKISFRLLGNTIIFKEITNYKKTVVIFDLISEIIDEKMSMDIYDLIQYLEINYNIIINKSKIVSLIKESPLYYDEIFEKVYIDHKKYLEEII